MTSSTPGDPSHTGDPTHGQPGQPQYGQPVPPESGPPQYGQPAYAPPPASQPPGYGQGQQYGQSQSQSQSQYGQPSQYGQAPQYGQQSAQYGAPQAGQPAPYGSAYPPAGNPYGNPSGNSGLVTINGLGPVKVASIGQRFLARLIDSVIYVVVYGIALAIGIGSMFSSTTLQTDSYGNVYSVPSSGGIIGFWLSMMVLFLFFFLYEWLLIGLKGQTVGKMAMGVKVVREDNGQVPGLGKSFVRQIIPWAASWLTCGLGGLLFYISVFFDNSGRNQTWYDKAATDLVISTK